MSYSASEIKTVKTIKALRGDTFSLDLGTTLEGELRAWMKRDPNDTIYRSFTIRDNRYLELSSVQTNDYLDVSGTVLQKISGKWYFDVERVVIGVGEIPDSVKTLYRGVILFTDDITGSVGTQIDETTTIEGLLNTKVDKVDGYDLSQNNFSDELKEKLETIDGAPKFTEGFVMSIPEEDSFGRFRNGDFVDAEGLDANELILLACIGVLNPTFINPTLSASLSITATQEVGTNYVANLSANFNRGSILGKKVSGVWEPNTVQDFRAGLATSYILDGVTQSSSIKSVSRTLVSGNNVFDARVSFGIGPQPKSSNDENFGTPYPAGFLNATATVISRRKQFFGPSVVVPTLSSQIRSLSGNNFENVNTFSINISTVRFVIAIPNNKQLVSVITQNNENITGNFTLTNFLVSDNGSGSSTYNIYTFESAIPLGLTANVILS